MQQGGNAYTNASTAMAGAGGALQNAQGYVNAANFSPNGGYTYNPTMIDPATGKASITSDPNAIRSGVNGYMNPYENDVIRRTANDVQNLTQQQLNDVGAKASGMGAFGGSRHGLVEATTMSEAQKNIGDISANMRNQGYNTALQYSAQDIANQQAAQQFNANQRQNMTLANMGAVNTARGANAGAHNAAGQYNAGARLAANQFDAQHGLNQAQILGQLAGQGQQLGQQYFDVGTAVNAIQGQQGQQQQNLIQQIMNNASGQFQGYVNQPTNILSMLSSIASGSPLNQATSTTSTTTPGFLDYLGLGAQTYGAAKGGAK
jgi:hypothetical protein